MPSSSELNKDTIKKNLTNNNKEKPFILGPNEVYTCIKGQFCMLVTLEDIQEAERFCRTWNKFKISQTRKLKAHIHPYSNPLRLRPEQLSPLIPLPNTYSNNNLEHMLTNLSTANISDSKSKEIPKPE